MKRLLLFCAFVALSASPAALHALDANPPGVLVSGSGNGQTSTTVYSPGMRFPIEDTPAFANSQVYGHGGYLGPDGGQCDTANYSFPWWDNFCESRSYETPMCPDGQGHQGQDIRPATCSDNAHWAVAAADGYISYIGSYTVTLQADDGTRYRYLHLSMDRLLFDLNDEVERGERIGPVSNDFGDTPTTIHLHFEIHQNVAAVGGVTPVPPYTSLVASYEAVDVPPEPCPALSATGGVVDDSQSSCFRRHGSAQFWRPVSDAGEGGSMIWTHAFVSDSPSNWAEWTLEVAEAGTYRVEASNARTWITAEGFNQSQALTYRVEHAGRVSEITVDQSDGNGWVSLGELPFASGTQSIAVFDNTGEDGAEERKIVVDAIRLTRIESGGEECVVADCTAGDGCSAWSECTFADGCALEGEQTRTCTTHTCEGEVCVADTRPETQACTRSEPATPEGTWVAVGECEPASDAGVCAEQGTRREERLTCAEGADARETRYVDCAIDTDGTVLELWSAWDACVGGVQAQTRAVCADGAIAVESRERACEDGGGRRNPPSEVDRSKSGCAQARVRSSWPLVVLFAFVVARRRRR